MIETSEHTCWLSWLDSCISAEVVIKRNQEVLFSTFDASVGKEQCVKAPKSYQESAFLHRTVVGDKRVAIFHHLVKVGGTLYDSAEKEFFPRNWKIDHDHNDHKFRYFEECYLR